MTTGAPLSEASLLEIYVDADACPVKDEVLRVAERHGLPVYIVSNSGMRPTGHPLVRPVVVTEGPDAADDWIVEHIAPGDICVTSDIPLASRCLKQSARAIRPDGTPFTEQSIGMALAMRDLMKNLRETGDVRGGNAAFGKADRSRFLRELEQLIQTSQRR